MTYYALNRFRRTVCEVNAGSWEELQVRALFGIVMPDNHVATGIGRCPAGELEKRASKAGYALLTARE